MITSDQTMSFKNTPVSGADHEEQQIQFLDSEIAKGVEFIRHMSEGAGCMDSIEALLDTVR